VTSHGVAITVLEEVDAARPGYDSFVKQAQHQQNRRLSARKILGWWRHVLNERIDEEIIKMSSRKVQGNTRGRDRVPSRNHEASTLKKSIATKLKRITLGDASKKKTLKQTPAQLSKKGSESLDELARSGLWSEQVARQISGSLQNRSTHLINLGKQSYEMMEASSKLGNICVVEKCYVMIGGKQSEQFLQFKSLQHLIKLESKVCSTPACCSQFEISRLMSFSSDVWSWQRRQNEAAGCSNGSSNGESRTSNDIVRHNFLGAVKTVS
jgi:hypothetical protein